MSKLPYAAGSDGQPCTAPQEADEPAPGSQGSGERRSGDVHSDLRQIMAGLDQAGPSQRQGPGQGRRQQPAARARGAKAGAGGSGAPTNTLAKYGFLRSSDSASKEFKRPRMDGGAAQRPDATASQRQQAQQPRPSGQAFLRQLQAADAAPSQFSMFAAGQGPPGGAAGQAAPAAAQTGASGLLAKLRGDLQEPGVDQLLRQRRQQQQERQQAEGAEVGDCDEEGSFELPAAAGASPAGHAARTPQDLGLRASPTVEELLTGGGVVIPESPGFSTGGPRQMPGLGLGAAGGGGSAAGRQQEQQITPGFYGVPDSEEQDPLLALASARASPGLGGEEEEEPREDGGGSAAEAAAADSGADADPIASLEHVPRFAHEARAAVDRAALQAVRAVAPLPMPLQPPSYLQQRRQQQAAPVAPPPQQQQSAVAAALKRPFCVPRRVEGEKENAGGAAKRSKQGMAERGAGANLFAKFTFK